MGLAEDIIIIILTGLFFGIIANKLKLPSIVGYIIAGIVIGPHTGGITVSDIKEVELLAEIGVALLLFSIGLDFSFRELKDVRGIALIGTPVQIILTIGYGIGIGFFSGFPLNTSIVFGMIISLSSTMIVLKVLMNRGLIGTLSSKVMIGMLIVQDLAAIPMIIIIPGLNTFPDNLGQIALLLLKSSVLLLIIIIGGMRIIPWFIKFVTKLESRELFLITITAVGLGVGYMTYLAGLSLAFGAFVSGMVINESEYSHQALNDIIPLRDVFGLVFFTSIGMLLNTDIILKNWMMIIMLVSAVIAGKFVIFSLLSVAYKYHNIIPLAMGFGLSQVGEFSFVLASSSLKSGIITDEFYSMTLTVSVITMLLTPLLSMLSAPVYSLRKKWFNHEEVLTVNITGSLLREHGIIAGGGRVGFQIATVFYRLGFPFIIIENDYRRFEKAKEAGFPVIYGDAGQETVLEGAKIANARMLVITIPSIIASKAITGAAFKKNPSIKIIARADDIEHMNELYKMNVFEVVQPEFEASIEMLRQSFLHLNIPITIIQKFTDEIRTQNYKPLQKNQMHYALLSKMRNTPFLLDTNWIEIPEGCCSIKKSIKDMAIRTKTGASVVGIIRDQKFIPNPEVDFVFQPGDLVAVIGLPENKRLFEELMLKKGGD